MSIHVLQVVASPRRREILRLLSESERSAGEIHRAMPDVSFGAVSLQLKILLDAELVQRRTAGTQRIYAIRPEVMAPIADMLQAMWSDALHHLKLQAELDQSRRGPRPTRKGGRRLRPRAPEKDSRR